MRALLIVTCCSAAIALRASHAQVPLPEHPRPDFHRAEWLNLNGRRRFAFDPGDIGERSGWPNGAPPAGRPIVVTLPWGAPLSRGPDTAHVGWFPPSILLSNPWPGR